MLDPVAAQDAATKAYVDAAASGVANLDLTSTNILVGGIGGKASDVPMSGDATIDTAGALTIANNAVTVAYLKKTGSPLSGFRSAAADVYV